MLSLKLLTYLSYSDAMRRLIDGEYVETPYKTYETKAVVFDGWRVTEQHILARRGHQDALINWEGDLCLCAIFKRVAPVEVFAPDRRGPFPADPFYRWIGTDIPIPLKHLEGWIAKLVANQIDPCESLRAFEQAFGCAPNIALPQPRLRGPRPSQDG